MSFWNVPDSDYRELAVATPGWQTAPVPGWGINPLRAGPTRVAIDGLGADPEAAYKETSWGVVALGAAVGIGAGLLFGYAWWGQKRLVANRQYKSAKRSAARKKKRSKRFRAVH